MHPCQPVVLVKAVEKERHGATLQSADSVKSAEVHTAFDPQKPKRTINPLATTGRPKIQLPGN